MAGTLKTRRKPPPGFTLSPHKCAANILYRRSDAFLGLANPLRPIVLEKKTSDRIFLCFPIRAQIFLGMLLRLAHSIFCLMVIQSPDSGYQELHRILWCNSAMQTVHRGNHGSRCSCKQIGIPAGRSPRMDEGFFWREYW